ncbi:MAG: tetratricopeptide repeat protein [Actinobacteria bacterium]|nr:tetratricopeptide repeat protein [Actinomycetota bacterium]
MGRLARSMTVVAIAAALFVAGSVGLGLVHGDRAPAGRTMPLEPSSVFLGPGDPASLDRSIEALQERVRSAPEDGRGWASLGLAYVRQARITADPRYYPRADGALRRSLRILPGNPDALLGLAALAAAEHDFEAALTLGTRVRDLNPYDANAHGIVGDALVELGRYGKGFASFQTMVDTRPDTASFARVSYTRELLGDLPGAIRAMQQARGYAGTPADAAWTSHHLGLLYLNQGRLVRASEMFRDGARLDPSSVQTLLGLSTVALARNDLPKAVRLMEDVVGRSPTPEFVIALGDLSRLSGDGAAATDSYDLARVGLELLESSGANADLETALFEADYGDPATALAAAEAAWAERRSIQAADAMAWALHVNERDHEAARYARRARSLGTREGLFFYHAGVIELARGNHEAGRSLLRRALAVDPWFSILGTQDARRLLHSRSAG